MKNILYLGSKSKSRQKLLDIAEIPYKILGHTADECSIDLSHDFEQYVLNIAKHKMENVNLPKSLDNEEMFILTADTLVQTKNTKQILGKPENKQDAIRMVKISNQEPIKVTTGCCLEKRSSLRQNYGRQKISNRSWKVLDKRYWTTSATIEFYIEENYIEKYFEKLPLALKGCGAEIVDDYGLNFLESINGSFTTVLGLPLFELRQNLKELGFFN